jgi:hypothetical protein
MAVKGKRRAGASAQNGRIALVPASPGQIYIVEQYVCYVDRYAVTASRADVAMRKVRDGEGTLTETEFSHVLENAGRRSIRSVYRIDTPGDARKCWSLDGKPMP